MDDLNDSYAYSFCFVMHQYVCDVSANKLLKKITHLIYGGWFTVYYRRTYVPVTCTSATIVEPT